MNEPAHSFLYRVWPYLALTLAAAGFVVRMLLTSDRLPAVRRALPRAQRLWVGGWPWLLGWALLVAAHLAGLLFPRAIIAWTRTPGRLFALEALGFAVGLAALAACIRAAWQHARVHPRGGWGLLFDFADAVFLTLLFIGVGSGLLAAGIHRWGSAWGSAMIAPYAASLVQGHPAPGLRRAPAVPGSPAPVRGVRGVRRVPGQPAGCVPAGVGAPRDRAGGPRADSGRTARGRVVAQQDGGVALAGAGSPLAGESPVRRRPAQAGRQDVRVVAAAAAQRRRGAQARGQDRLMRLRGIVFGFVALGAGGGLLARGATRIGVHQGYAPEQPIAFPHKVHAGDNKIACLYCHSAARTSRHAGIPSASVCMNCHALLEKQTTEIQRLKEAVQQARPVCLDEGPQPPRLRLLQPQPARRLRRRLPALPRRGRADGPHRAGRAAHHGLVSRLPPRRGARPHQHVRARRRERPRPAHAVRGRGLHQLPLLIGDDQMNRRPTCDEAMPRGDGHDAPLVQIGLPTGARSTGFEATRRDVLSLMGFSLGAMGLGAGCRAPVQHAVPLPSASTEMVPGVRQPLRHHLRRLRRVLRSGRQAARRASDQDRGQRGLAADGRRDLRGRSGRRAVAVRRRAAARPGLAGERGVVVRDRSPHQDDARRGRR